jgi:hypothetical protein
MHASGEGHTGYIYKRREIDPCAFTSSKCDPFFQEAWDTVRSGLDSLRHHVGEKMDESYGGGRATRSRGIQHIVEIEDENSEELKEEVW